ncbi:GntR family transcriptional regulator [Geminicoccus roseus]|uniref:GntR family transcriptional regulator n=1 Tax=Geminicoccus roseus TaxID=404900 RepID=UPI00146FBE3E|nr:GntR family transcriptional regulator [Geminicoccus roseus]
MAVKRKTLREQIKDALVSRITSGRIRPGERLVEMRIAEEFGTSQAPVREALRELEAIGFVTTRAHRGTIVRDFSEAGLREVYVVRGALEEAATRLATPRLAKDTRRLQASVDAMRAAAQAGDLDAMCTHSVAFHRQIVEASGNALLLSMWTSLQIETRTIITLLAPGLDLLAIAETHQPLVDAIAMGDVEQACTLARTHQEWFEELPTVADAQADALQD